MQAKLPICHITMPCLFWREILKDMVIKFGQILVPYFSRFLRTYHLASLVYFVLKSGGDF